MSKCEFEIEALFKQYEGTHELSYRLEDFIANCIAVGKDVRMDTILKQLKLVLKKVFEKIIALKCNDDQQSRRLSVIVCILETVTAICDANEEGKSAVVDFVYPCLELLARKEEHLTARLEANRFLNIIIESCSKKKLGSLPFVKNFDDLLASAGDLELQLCMTELICRVLSCESRQIHAQKWFEQNPESRDDFLSIRDVEFESDSRKFVNNLNERQLENRSVYSVLCKEVCIGSQKVDCPNDDGSNGMFWTDFNLGSKSISFFAINEKNDVWETVTIKEDSVVQTQILEKKESQEIVLLVQLNIPTCTLLSHLQQGDEKYVKFIYDEKNSPFTPASLLFPKDFASITTLSPDVIASTPKASVTSNAVHLSSRTKGLSKTVSLLTPRRRKEKGESSDESSHSNSAASSKEKEIGKSLSNNKEASSRDTKDKDTQIKSPTVDDDNKQRSSSIGNENIDTKPEKAQLPFDQDVSGEEISRPRTRSSLSNDVGNLKDQNQTEIEQQGQEKKLTKESDDRSLGENGLGKSIDSGLGKSIDSGLGKSVDNQDSSIKDVNDEEHSRCLQDVSQGEPTVIHETQTISQGGVDGKNQLDDHVLLGDEDEEPLSVNAKSYGVRKDVKKTDDDRDSSSGPFTKRKKTEMEPNESECSTVTLKKPTKTTKAKAITKTRQIRTRAAAKKKASIGPGVSTSESEISDKIQQAKAKLVQSGSKSSKALTRSRSVDDLDKKNKLGSGYNTEDWMMGYSDPDRRTERKKALATANALNASQSRLSLLNTVYRENNRWDSKRKRVKLGGPWEFRCSPPSKRNPQGKILVRTSERTYHLKKEVELKQKREKKGIIPKETMSRSAFKEMKKNQKSFSDIALEVLQNSENELKKHHLESDVLNRAREPDDDEQSTKVVLSDVEEKSTMTRTDSGKVDEDADQILGPADDAEDSQLTFNDQQMSADRTAEPDENSLDGNSLPSPVKGFLDAPTGKEANDDAENRTEKADTRETEDQEVINDEQSKKDMEKRKEKDSEESPRERKARANSYSESLTEKSVSTDRPREIENSLNNVDDASGPDDEGGQKGIQKKKVPKNKKQGDVSEASSRTKSNTESNQHIPAKKSTIGKASRYQTRGKQKRKNEESTELENDGCFFDTLMGEKGIERIETLMTERKPAEESDDGSLSSDTAFIFDAFRKSSERIIADSDYCIGRRTSVNKASSRKQSETMSKNKTRIKSMKSRRESPTRKEHLCPDDEMDFKLNTPKVNFSRNADSGFFDKTPNFSSKKRTYDKRDKTPSSANSDVRETPGVKASRKSQRFGRLIVQSTSSRTPNRGYQSNDDKRSFRLQEEHDTPEEDYMLSHSQPTSGNQGSRKRKGGRDNDNGLKSEVLKDLDSQDYANDSFKTPVDSQSMSIHPRKLFQSSDYSSAKKIRKGLVDDDDDDVDDGGGDIDDGSGDDDIEDEFDDDLYIGKKMQTSFANLGKELRKTIKKRQDYVSQITTGTMKLITAESEEMLSKRTSRRHAVINEFTDRVNQFVDEHQRIAIRSVEIENKMVLERALVSKKDTVFCEAVQTIEAESQVKNCMKDLAEQRKAQKECLHNILKTKEDLTESFERIEVTEKAQQRDFHNSLQKELNRYRDQAAKEVEKEEFQNIKRRIQAMLGMSL